jgi:hypothetical protein
LYYLLHKKARTLGLSDAKYSIASNEKIVEVLESYRESIVRNTRQYYSREFKKSRLSFADVLAEIQFLPNISKYVVESVEKKWLDNWIKTDFKGGKKNKDLWLQYHKIAAPFTIKFHWVKGHSDNPHNNRCDVLATEAADNGPWKIDTEFELIEAKK